VTRFFVELRTQDIRGRCGRENNYINNVSIEYCVDFKA
jgi:hypothetical protein